MMSQTDKRSSSFINRFFHFLFCDESVLMKDDIIPLESGGGGMINATSTHKHPCKVTIS